MKVVSTYPEQGRTRMVFSDACFWISAVRRPCEDRKVTQLHQALS